MDELLEALAEILDVDEVGPDDAFDDFEDWDSLAVLSVVATVDSDYNVNLSSAEVRGCANAQALFDLIGQKKG